MTLGTICHGLLNQRKALAEALKNMAARYPEVANDIRLILNDSKSAFRSYSDDLLQFVCAHRAEAIGYRR